MRYDPRTWQMRCAGEVESRPYVGHVRFIGYWWGDGSGRACREGGLFPQSGQPLRAKQSYGKGRAWLRPGNERSANRPKFVTRGPPSGATKPRPTDYGLM